MGQTNGQKERMLLTYEQALDAVCRDLEQYEPQIILCCEILRLASDGHIVTSIDRKKQIISISDTSTSTPKPMKTMDDHGLIQFTCTTLKTMHRDMQVLASICGRVFRTRAYLHNAPETGEKLIAVETGMEQFQCQMCGQCCRTLDYHGELTHEDVVKWQDQGRQDILDWVGMFKRPDGTTAYRIWIKPGTIQLAEVCPFLKKVPDANQWICTIHTMKPQICKDYPVSKKHALMTGCPGVAPKS